MSYGLFARVNKQGHFLGFVVDDKGSKYKTRVKMSDIDKRKKEVSRDKAETIDISLRLAMYDLDSVARKGFPIHRDWQRAATNVAGFSAIKGSN